jgi:hypothetical protein
MATASIEFEGAALLIIDHPAISPLIQLLRLRGACAVIHDAVHASNGRDR